MDFGSGQAIFGASGGSVAGVSVNANDMPVRYTLYFDANLDTKLDISDLARLATAWQGASGWSSGDFNHDQKIDISDLALLAPNWQAALAPPSATLIPRQSLDLVLTFKSLLLRDHRRIRVMRHPYRGLPRLPGHAGQFSPVATENRHLKRHLPVRVG